MKTIWNYSLQTEAERILPAAHHIRTRFYQKKHFFVLPHIVEKNSKVICFPNLDYLSIPNFWERVAVRENCLQINSPDLVSSLVDLLPEPRLNYTGLKKAWESVAGHLFPRLTTLLPGYFDGIDTLEIRPTQYGSVAASLSAWLPEERNLIVYIRLDCDISHIVEAMFIDRLDKVKDVHSFNWEEKEAIMDFLLMHTPLKELFPHYSPTLAALKDTQQGKLMEQSKAYLQELGFGTEQVFTQKGNEVELLGKNFPLVNSEKKLMNLLLVKRGTVVSYDDIAEVLWEKDADEKFSLYAISKTVERLRTRVKSAGVFPDIIQTVRGTGYILND